MSFLDLQAPILAILFSLQLIFAFFDIGQKMHSDLMDVSDMLYQSEWYRYPCSVRRFVLLMMIRAQQPFYLSAYGVMRCTLENFVRVSTRASAEMKIVSSVLIKFIIYLLFQLMNWIYSAFMVLRYID